MDSSTSFYKDEPIDGWLRRSRHHGHSNRQVQVAKCTSTSAEYNDTKFMASSKPKRSSPRSPDHGADAAGPSAANSAVVLVSVPIVPNKPVTSRLSEHSEVVMPAVVMQHAPAQQKPRRKRHLCGRDKRGQIPNRRTISERPRHIEDRKRS